MSTLDLALLYADMGLSVFPLPRGSKVPLKGFRWTDYRERQADRHELQEWFGSGERNIGIITGDVSGGLAVRDFDEREAYHQWRESHRMEAETLPTVKTARGFHVYARGRADTTKQYSDGEFRAGGTYVLAPPSLHPSGVTYSWTRSFRGVEIPEVDLGAVGWLQDPSCNIETEKRRNVSNVCVSMLQMDGVLQAIKKCIPSQVGHRHKCLFRLARELKAIAELADLKAKALRPVLLEWHHQALPTIGTKDFSTSWLEFCSAWDRVRYPAGTSPVDEAWQAALSADFPPELADCDNAKIGRLAGLCWQLQIRQGEQPFFLDSRTAGQLLDVEHTVAWRWLRGLVSAGVLELVRSGGRGRANIYRYLKD
ncbi:hypothetical protein Mal52_01720 [Symmachiella dynata]|uniref:DNA primase/polymerase bifunctional N-terminal domain-containing protein n=1 Tax=Symmachiella dynata TaxID=2527995 RepID=A0A517ZGZ0_9PLAN|nr:bifunctional DNA primase/polymerase [Symmachiella dynata]QDU41719.1 hypothetical protein Mal52_01720 [Symmachiella dynata]